MKDTKLKFGGREKLDLSAKLLYLWLCELFAMTVARFTLSRLGFNEGYVRSVTLFLVASVPMIIFFINMHRLDSKKYIPFFVMYFFIIIAILLSILLNPDLWYYFDRKNYGFDRILQPNCALYAFLFFSLQDDPEKLLKHLSIYAFFDFVFLIFVELMPALSRGYWIDIDPKGREIHLAYSLSFGYMIMFPTVVFIYLFIKKKKLYFLALAIGGLWCVLTQGNRGALIIPIVFIGLMLISYMIGKDSVSKKTLKIASIFISMGIVWMYSQTLLDQALKLVKKYGISSRNIEMLISGNMSNDNGREVIWNTVINAINNGGPFGYGVLGDRPFVSPIHYVGYSHNLFLEMTVSLGIIGMAICVYIVLDAVRMIFLCKVTAWRELYIIFFSVSFQLMLSMSFWYVWEFWAAAAIAFKYRSLKKKGAVEQPEQTTAARPATPAVMKRMPRRA